MGNTQQSHIGNVRVMMLVSRFVSYGFDRGWRFILLVLKVIFGQGISVILLWAELQFLWLARF